MQEMNNNWKSRYAPSVLVFAPLPKSDSAVARVNALVRRLQSVSIVEPTVAWVHFEPNLADGAGVYNREMVVHLELLLKRLEHGQEREESQNGPLASAAGIVLHAFDAVACDLAGMLRTYFASPRCGRHLISEQGRGGGGVLYIGAGAALHRHAKARQRIAEDVLQNTDTQGLGNPTLHAGLLRLPTKRKHGAARNGNVDNDSGQIVGNETGVYDGYWDHLCYNVWSPAETCPREDIVAATQPPASTNGGVGSDAVCKSGHSCFSAVYHHVALAGMIEVLRAKLSVRKEVHACTIASELGHRGHVTRAATVVLTVPPTSNYRTNERSDWCVGT